MPRGRQYTPHPFIQVVSRALDELIEAQSDSLVEYYLSASEKWEMPQGAFEDLLASSPRIRGCADWDVEIFWIAVADAANRGQGLVGLFLRRLQVGLVHCRRHRYRQSAILVAREANESVSLAAL